MEQSLMPETPATNEQPKETPSKAEAIAKIKELQSQLQRQANQEYSGAASNATATMMLDKSEAEKLNPGSRVRWVSLRNEQKAAARQASGYVRLAAEEGGRQVGSLVLMKLPAEEHARRVKQIDQLTQDRLHAHEKEAENMAVSLARELRDNHGIRVDPEKLFGPRAGEPRR
jgi:hypothetical protein